MTRLKSTPVCIGSRCKSVASGLVAASLLFGFPTSASAQTALTGTERSAATAAKLRTLTTPNLGSPIVAPAPVFTLESSADATTAKALLAMQVRDFTLSSTFSGPVRKGNTTTFAGLDGLRNKSSVEFGVSYMDWAVPPPDAILGPACELIAARKGKKLSEIDCTDLKTIRSQLSEIGESIGTAIDPGNVLIFSASYKRANDKFEFLDPATLAPQSPEQRTSRTITLGIGRLTRGNLLLAANYKHEKAYSAGGLPAEICKPLTAGALQCESAILGGPLEATTEFIQLEARRFVLSNLAVNPRFTRARGSNGAWSADLPIYFISNGDGGLTGGVNIGWKKGQSGPSITVFVGEVLKLIAR